MINDRLSKIEQGMSEFQTVIMSGFTDIKVSIARLEERQRKSDEREHPTRECQKEFCEKFVLNSDFESKYLGMVDKNRSRFSKLLSIVSTAITIIGSIGIGAYIGNMK